MIQGGLYYGPPDADHHCAYLYIKGGQPRFDLHCPNDIGFYVKIPDGRGDDWRKAWAACAEHLPIVIWQMQEAYSGRTFYEHSYVMRAFVPEGTDDGHGVPERLRDGREKPEAEVPGADTGQQAGLGEQQQR